MRPLPLWRHEIRRTGRLALLPAPLAPALVVAVTLLNGSEGSQREVMRNLFATVEMGLPLVAGIGAASLVGRDRAVELQLTLPTPYRATLLRRLAVTLGGTVLVAVVVVALLMSTDHWPDTHGPVVGQLVWLAPTLWLAAVGFFAGVALRSPAAAGGLVAVLWLVQLLFGGTVQEQRWSRQLYLFATNQGTVPAEWLGNRMTLVATGIALGLAGWLLLGRTERLVGGEIE